MTGTIKTKGVIGLLLVSLVVAWGGIALAQQGRGMGIAENALPEHLRGLNVKDAYIPSDSREIGVIHALNGQVVVVHLTGQQAYFGKPGDRIYENDELNTLGDSRCRIRFYSDDVVNMAPDTRFAVEAFEDRRGEGRKSSVFSMIKGKAMFYALRLFRYKESRFEVKTPTAVLGVRGTQFGIDVFWVDEKTAEGGEILVADNGRSFDALLAQAGQGRASGTRVACGDGSLEVTDPATGQQMALVNANEDYNSYTGRKIYDPANRTLNEIQQASQVREDGEETPSDTTPEEPQVQGEGESSAVPVGLTEEITNVTTQQVGDETSQSSEETGGWEPPKHWYFAAMLTNKTWPSSTYLEDVFVGDAGKPGELTEWVGRGQSIVDGDYTDYRYGFPGYFENFTHDGSGSREKDIHVETAQTLVGSNQWNDWGYWTTSVEFTGSGPFAFDNKIWWVDGPSISPEALAQMKGTVPYSGSAHGTYWTKAGGTDMSGSFRCDIDYSSAAVKNFDLRVDGGGVYAEIKNAEGAFSSDTSSSHFEYKAETGTWDLNGTSPGHKEFWGNVYGNNADATAGAWGMYNSSSEGASSEGAVGIFQGTRR